MEDIQIIDLYWLRDERAISETDSKYGAFCHRIAMNILHSFQDSEECVSDTYGRCWDTMPPQRPGSLRAYLGTIIRNLSISRYRASRAQKRFGGAELAKWPDEIRLRRPEALEKARRLENMISEFFEITRYNTQQITIDPKPVDLYYLLVQVIDEHIPLFTEHGNYVTLRAQEPLQVWGDGEKLARVFNNLLKNAAAYSDPGTEVIVSAEAGKEAVSVRVTSTGKTIPTDKLDALFEKFYRLDDARTSHTGGTGLGLAIAKEIVALHGGTISAESEGGQTTFTVQLPVREKT